jgi:thiamine-phosphate pyrophosphorylase
MSENETGAARRERLAAACLYLVCPTLQSPAGDGAAGPPASAVAEHGRALGALVRAAVAGGVDIVQLREKHLGEEQTAGLAADIARVCADVGALFILNDSPRLAREVGADGVHVGQDDMPPADARAVVGPDMLVGLSTHARAEIDAAGALPAGAPRVLDYIAVGPVHETPTKPGRPAVGVDLIAYAAAHTTVPFFAIGGLDANNLADVLEAGARRAVILRAIAAADDPEAAARELYLLLEAASGSLPGAA